MTDSNAHHFERVDLLVDAHRADLGGGACSDGCGQRHARGRRCDEADVEEGAKETGEGLDTDVRQSVVALHGDQRAGGQREEPDDDDRPADDGQGPGSHPHSAI